VTVLGLPRDKQPISVKEFAAKHGKHYNHALSVIKAGRVKGVQTWRSQLWLPYNAEWPEPRKSGRKPKVVTPCAPGAVYGTMLAVNDDKSSS
jgi:hypothetical protein